jgi:hypothetical protein
MISGSASEAEHQPTHGIEVIPTLAIFSFDNTYVLSIESIPITKSRSQMIYLNRIINECVLMQKYGP